MAQAITAVPGRGYTDAVPTRHPRIQVPRDPQLDRAIARGRALMGPDVPASQVVHDLALRGLEAAEADALQRAEGREFLVSVAAGSSGLDLEALRTVRDRAWR